MCITEKVSKSNTRSVTCFEFRIDSYDLTVNKQKEKIYLLQIHIPNYVQIIIKMN